MKVLMVFVSVKLGVEGYSFLFASRLPPDSWGDEGAAEKQSVLKRGVSEITWRAHRRSAGITWKAHICASCVSFLACYGGRRVGSAYAPPWQARIFRSPSGWTLGFSPRGFFGHVRGEMRAVWAEESPVSHNGAAPHSTSIPLRWDRTPVVWDCYQGELPGLSDLLGLNAEISLLTEAGRNSPAELFTRLYFLRL